MDNDVIGPYTIETLRLVTRRSVFGARILDDLAEAGVLLPPGAKLVKEFRVVTRDGRGGPVPWSMATEDEDQADFDLGVATGEGNWPGLAKQSRWVAESPWHDVEDKSDG